MSLHNHLKRIGCTKKKSKAYGEYIQERASVALQRSRYLEVFAKYRAEKREIFYQDESWVSANTRTDTQWWHDDMEPDTRVVRSGKGGERTTLCGVGSSWSGWLNGRDSFLMYHGKLRMGTDYYEEMNWKVFLDWVEGKVVPYIPNGSVLVIDRASYHLVKTDDTNGPDGDSKSIELLAWLRAKEIPLVDSFGEDWTSKADAAILKRPNKEGTGGLSRPELQRLAKLNKPEPRYLVQDLLDAEDSDLRLLPTHITQSSTRSSCNGDG
jgi:hypothetical protein